MNDQVKLQRCALLRICRRFAQQNFPAGRGDEQATTLYQNGIREIAAKIAEMAKYPAIYRVEPVKAQLGHDAGLFGAANMVEVT